VAVNFYQDLSGYAQGHTTLTMTNHYASLKVEHLWLPHEKFSPLQAKGVIGDEERGKNYCGE